MTTVKIKIAYKGTHFSGWQLQPKSRTVQGVIESTIKDVIGEDIRIQGASRTDAGVHAMGQVARVHYQCSMPPERFCFAINRALPSDVVILKAEQVEENFHPIVHTESKVYHYKVHQGSMRDPFQDEFSWHVNEPLDIELMRAAAEVLKGEHDFKSFCSAGSSVKSTVREVYSIEIEADGELILFKYHGNGFLYNMIRIMTAVLVKVGKGQLSIDKVRSLLEAKDRNKVPWTAPPQGLYLMEIFY